MVRSQPSFDHAIGWIAVSRPSVERPLVYHLFGINDEPDSLVLTEEDYRDHSQRIDTVIHSGALVDYLRDYSGHRSANVLGTLEVLRFAGAGRTHQEGTGSAVESAAGGTRSWVPWSKFGRITRGSV